MSMAKASAQSSKLVTARVPMDLVTRVQKAQKQAPYPPSLSKIVVRGLQLALREMETKHR